MKTQIVAVWLLVCVAVFSADDPLEHYSIADIETAVRSGKVGSEYAERAKKMQDLRVREIVRERIPYQLFTFSDFRGGYTLLVEAKDKFVVLCTAMGGGYAYNFTLAKEKDKEVLYYLYNSGSGRRFEHRAKYVIGSGKPEDTAARSYITP
jgi:hypothetical protein